MQVTDQVPGRGELPVLAEPTQSALSARGRTAVHGLHANGRIPAGPGPQDLVHVSDRKPAAAERLRHLGRRDAADRSGVGEQVSRLVAARRESGFARRGLVLLGPTRPRDLVLSPNHNYRVAVGMFTPGYVWYSGVQGYWLTNGGGFPSQGIGAAHGSGNGIIACVPCGLQPNPLTPCAQDTSGSWAYPNEVEDDGDNYFVDLEVLPVAAVTSNPTRSTAGPSSSSFPEDRAQKTVRRSQAGDSTAITSMESVDLPGISISVHCGQSAQSV